jgi:hypothetical protein
MEREVVAEFGEVRGESGREEALEALTSGSYHISLVNRAEAGLLKWRSEHWPKSSTMPSQNIFCYAHSGILKFRLRSSGAELQLDQHVTTSGILVGAPIIRGTLSNEGRDRPVHTAY